MTLVRRELNEAKVCGDLELIFPIVNYRTQLKIEELYTVHEKRLK